MCSAARSHESDGVGRWCEVRADAFPCVATPCVLPPPPASDNTHYTRASNVMAPCQLGAVASVRSCVSFGRPGDLSNQVLGLSEHTTPMVDEAAPPGTPDRYPCRQACRRRNSPHALVCNVWLVELGQAHAQGVFQASCCSV